MEVLLEWFAACAETLNVDVQSLMDTNQAQQSSVTLALASNRNRIMMFQLGVQAVTMGCAACSVVSGYFGMNLSNGWCGPDGCLVLGTTSFGHDEFIVVVSVTTIVSIVGSLTFLWYVVRQ